MLSLRHLALDAHIGTGAKYDGGDMAIEHVIFEVDQLKDRLEKEIEDLQEDFKFTQKIKNSKVQNFSNKFWKLTEEISAELFDDFSYSGVASTDGEVEWKEYFHTVYDAVVPDDRQVYIHQVWDVLPEPPCELDSNNRCWPLMRSIQNKFDQLKIEGGKVDTLTHILNYQTNLGKEMISLKKEITEKSKTLSLYYRILEWSMH
jgi:enoyl-[acyl-carrier-protein] reductase (NADH)